MAASLRIAAATASRAATARGGCALPAAAVAGARAASSSSSGSSSSSSSSSSNPMPDPPESSQPAPAPAQAEAQAQAQATQQPSFATSASTLAAQAAAKPLPFLSSAPGFPFPPACIANAPTPPSSSSSPSSRTASLSSSPASSSTGTGTGTGAASGSTASTAKPSASSSKMQAREARIYAERKAIVAEATKGYFHDFHALRAHGGKTWRAPSSLIRAERARWWPDWTGRRLSDGSSLSTAQIMRGRTSVVSVLSSQASEEHVRSFVRPTVATFATHPGFQHVRINVQLSALRAFLLRIVFNSLRASVGAEAEKEAGLQGQGQGSGMQEAAERAQRTYFLCTAAPEVPARVLEMELEAARQRAAGGASPTSADAASSSSSATTSSGTSHSPGAEAFLRSALCLHNKHVGYVFLVDAECKIRWAGCAFAEEAEREALRACTGVLLARH
ncbi:Mitochondrial ATPase complex subunit atp10 [Tilletia horrida]|nr:Mitochondrial ATPase complex subunit atp10 [Tilletia horrida]